jgi:AcrR family transcriptional regulator
LSHELIGAILSHMKGGARTPPEADTRPYRMAARRDAVERSRQRILQVALDLWLSEPYDVVTLDAIAESAGVTRQTVHRQFGSKEELASAVVDWFHPREAEASLTPDPGDVAASIRIQMDRYERTGDAFVRFLQIEGRIAPVDRLVALGRRSYRAELEHVFGPYLPARGRRRDDAVLALYAATDVMVWKLLRRDFGRSRQETELIIRRLVDGVLATLPAPTKKGTP